MSSSSQLRTVVPAQLAFLTIYNPAFGDSDDTAYEQIFFYYSAQPGDYESTRSASQNLVETRDNAAASSQEEQKNERLRQVGLTRGMVEFANNFSDDAPVDVIETEKSRIVPCELEAGWWILASINLTRIPSASRTQESADTVEYSSREVAPGPLLVSQLKRAHAIFLLHHAASLNDLHSGLGRQAFSATLDKYWSSFGQRWDVLLHGNPIADLCNCTKLAGGGEVGIGVGEEEWGSGEREVLEDFVHRTDGLIDLLVGRYGDAPDTQENTLTPASSAAWLGKGEDPSASNGLVFSGIGALSKQSLSAISQWMELIFTDGNDAYGIGDNPSSRPRQRRKKHTATNRSTSDKHRDIRVSKTGDGQQRSRKPQRKPRQPGELNVDDAVVSPGIPPPITSTVERALEEATKKAQEPKSSQPLEATAGYFDTDKMVGYLKLGYGSSWTLNPKGFSVGQDEQEPSPTVSQRDSVADSQPGESATTEVKDSEEQHLNELDPVPEVSESEEPPEVAFVQRLEQSIGRFLIGLSGDLENAEFEAESTDDATIGETATDAIRNTSRIVLRTVTTELGPKYRRRVRSASPARAHISESHDKIRVAVYVHQPFIFVFLFDLQTASLTIPSFYRSIHHQLGPLQKPLLRSTDPRRIPERIAEAIGDKVNHLGSAGIYDLIYDPAKSTIRTSIPNIPLPGTLAAEGLLSTMNSTSSRSGSARTVSGAWYTLGIPIGTTSSTATQLANANPSALLKSDYTRLDALNIHSQLLHTWIATRSGQGQGGEADIERTVKTSRGWWIVWMRYPMNPKPTTLSRQKSDVPPSASTVTSPSAPGTPMPAAEQMEGSRPDIEGRGVEIEAFLVRRAVDPGGTRGDKGRSGGASGRWLIGGGNDGNRSVSGASAASSSVGGTSARGVVEGMGVDARKWVEGLVKLSS